MSLQFLNVNPVTFHVLKPHAPSGLQKITTVKVVRRLFCIVLYCWILWVLLTAVKALDAFDCLWWQVQLLLRTSHQLSPLVQARRSTLVFARFLLCLQLRQQPRVESGCKKATKDSLCYKTSCRKETCYSKPHQATDANLNSWRLCAMTAHSAGSQCHNPRHCSCASLPFSTTN